MAQRFHFFRAGGVDQVSLLDGSDVLALSDLDQKLWVALAMPMKGTSIETDTLSILDADADGRVRVKDILAAVTWAKDTFNNVNDLLAGKDPLALSAIKNPAVVSAAKHMLSDLGKKDATSISVADTAAINKAFAETVLNGDSIVIAASAGDKPELAKVIETAIASVGSVPDRSGKPGIDKALADQFFAEVDNRAAWLAKGKDPALATLGDKTEAAAAATNAIKTKLADYFTRCRLAAFDDRAAPVLRGEEAALVELAKKSLTDSDELIASLPLGKIDPSGRLRLAGINPAWADKVDAFVAAAVTPILGPKTELTAADLAAVTAKLAPYQGWLDSKPATKVDALDAATIEELAKPEPRKQIADLIAADGALAGEYTSISEVTKAVRMNRDFGRILRNFVNFSDFYSKQDGAFQAGTLYLDARALHLCVHVTDAAKHGALAAASDACLLYCDITRKGETKQIACALTNGDADNVFVGRNGVFYDRDGNDWDATISKIISNPISVRAAFWSPYKKMVKAIEDNIQKRAAAADAASHAKMEAAGAKLAEADKHAIEAAKEDAKAEAKEAVVVPAVVKAPAAPDAPPEAKKIDLGTIAAIGVAIGGIGTLFGALLATLFGLGMFLPFGVLALLLMISGPSMLLAWLKLRRRNLGPILDANGWAINGRARINVAFGAAMTEMAKLPPGAKRSLDDPFADKRTPWKRWVVLVVVLGLAGAWYLGKLDNYLPDSVTSESVLGDNAPASKRKAREAAEKEAAEKAAADKAAAAKAKAEAPKK